MKIDKMDDLLEEVCKSEEFYIKGINDIDVLNFEETMVKFKKNLELDKKVIVLSNHTNRNRSMLKKIGIVACILIFSIFLSIIYELPKVKALKFNIIKSIIGVKDGTTTIKHSNNGDNQQLPDDKSSEGIKRIMTIEEAQKSLPFHLYIPQYVPVGYVFQKLEWTKYITDENLVVLYYSGKDVKREFIRIFQYTNQTEVNSTTNIKNNDNTVKQLVINGHEVTLILSTEPVYSEAIWYMDNTRCEISSSITEEQIIKIINALK